MVGAPGTTFAEAWGALEVILLGESFSLEVQAWRHDRGPGVAPHVTIEWKAYLCEGGHFLTSPSVDVLLAKVRDVVAARPPPAQHRSGYADVAHIGEPPAPSESESL
jgi:hypothetical protein